MAYSWTAYPPPQCGAKTQPIFAATVNGVVVEGVDNAFARSHAGVAANYPTPLGFAANDGLNQDVRYPENLPSCFDSCGYWRGFGAERQRDLAIRMYNGAYCSTPQQCAALQAFITMNENEY